MQEIKPNWRMAQQISRRHTFVSCSIMLVLFLAASIFAIVVLKCLGYSHSGLVLKKIVEKHQKVIFSTVLFIQLVPINYYAIIRVFSSEYPKFQLKIFSKDPKVR